MRRDSVNIRKNIQPPDDFDEIDRHDRKAIGDLGERLCENYYISRGYTILERNYRTRRGEIDRIAARGDHLIFIEVKARSGDLYGYAQEFVDRRKRERLRYSAKHFLAHRKQEGLAQFSFFSFDVVEIDIGKRQIHCIPDAFSMEENA